MFHLTRVQRQQIAEGIRLGKNNTRIARELNVHPSTVGREIKRNAASREEYSATFAHTMAASRQIQAARERFACAAEAPKPTVNFFRFSPYQELCLPALAYWRPLVSGSYAPYLSTSSFYFYCKDQYLVFTRFDQPPGLFRPSGKKWFTSFSAYDHRCRTDIHAGSQQFTDSFSSSHTSEAHTSSQADFFVPTTASSSSYKPVDSRTDTTFKTVPSKGTTMQSRVFTLAKDCPKDSQLPVKMIFPLAEGWNFQFSA